MARHTHDEHIYYYHCCNTTGLPPDTPQIVWKLVCVCPWFAFDSCNETKRFYLLVRC
jgi:hypothetical protein